MRVTNVPLAIIITVLVVVAIVVGIYVASLRYEWCRQTTNYSTVQCVLMSGR